MDMTQSLSPNQTRIVQNQMEFTDTAFSKSANANDSDKSFTNQGILFNATIKEDAYQNTPYDQSIYNHSPINQNTYSDTTTNQAMFLNTYINHNFHSDTTSKLDFYLNLTANQSIHHNTTAIQDIYHNTISNQNFYQNHDHTINITLNSSTYWCWNDTTQPHDEDFYEFYETAQFVTGLILYPCICVPGLMGNILTLLVLSHKNMRTSTNAFLSALAVADSIKLINDILYFFTILLLRTDDEMGNKAYGYLYPYAHFIFCMSVCVSSWLTVSVAVERYILVCHPTRAREVCNRGRAVLVCAGVFLVMTALALPSALRYKTVECVRRDTLTLMLQVELTEMWKNEVFVLAYNWAQNLLRSIIPLIVLVILNTCIIGAVRKTRANRKNSSRHRVTMMMVIVILVFLVCITPDAIMSTVFGQGYTEADYLVKGVREFTDTLLAINAATNFVIYCLFNRVFLDGAKSLFCSSRVAVSKKWQTELDESTYKRLNEAGKSVTNSTAIHSNNNSNNNGSSPGL